MNKCDPYVMTHHPRGAIESLRQIQGLLKRVKNGEKISLYWADWEEVSHGYPLSLDADLSNGRSYQRGNGEPEVWRIGGQTNLYLQYGPGAKQCNYLFTNYWHAWGHHLRCKELKDNT